MKILFVFYDNESRDNIMPLGMAYVAGYARANGFKDIYYYNQDVFHYPDEHLGEYLKENHFDVVAMGFVAGYYQHIKIKRLAEQVTKQKDNRPFLILGGHGPSPIPEYFIHHTGADAVVMGEGELPFLNLLKALENSNPLSEVNGIAYRDGEKVHVNKREAVIKKLDEIPFPYVEPLPMEYYVKSSYLTNPTDRGINFSAQRGCPFLCNFCYRLEQGMRFRSVDSVVEEIKKYRKDYNINYIWFFDELLMIHEKRMFALSEAFLENNLNIKWFCAGRLDIVTDRMLAIMKKAGCVAIDYGIEQYDDNALSKMDKRLTVDDFEHGIQLTLKHGIQPLFNIIFGNLGDTADTLRKSLDFLHKYNDYTQLRAIRPVTPYPGSPLYNHAIANGMLTGPEDFFNKHVNLELPTVNFTDLSDDEFIKLLYSANEEIIDKYYEHIKELDKEAFRKVYFEKNFNFRGVRH